jgi:hypothetical protein
MKFRISRVSHYSHAKPRPSPCDGAYLEGDEWFIEVDNLDELMKLAALDSEGIIVGAENPPRICIYDGYVE